jgi:hypothetical protein
MSIQSEVIYPLISVRVLVLNDIPALTGGYSEQALATLARR